jgi:putative endonuclease
LAVLAVVLVDRGYNQAAIRTLGELVLVNWMVYMITASDGSLYTGITTDMARRWREHCAGNRGARYFRGRSPKRIAYLEPSADRSSASQRESQIKRLTRTQKLLLIQSSRNELGCAVLNYGGAGCE